MTGAGKGAPGGTASVTQDAFGLLSLPTPAFGATMDYTGLTTTGSANLIIAAIVNRNIVADLTSVVWDPAGANQTMTQLATQGTSSSTTQALFIYGLLNPASSGNKTIRLSSTSTVVVYGVAAVSYAGANSGGINSAVPPGSIVIPSRALGATTFTASVTIAAGHYTLILDHSSNNLASSYTCSTNTDIIQSVAACYYSNSSTSSLTFGTVGGVEDIAGIGIDISP
jgi:hypothetical protein